MLLNKASQSVQTMNINISDSKTERCCNKIEVYFEKITPSMGCIYDIYVDFRTKFTNFFAYFDLLIFKINLKDCK